MDTTETNIKMCKTAEEIQNAKPLLVVGDYWCWASCPEQIYLVRGRELELEDRRCKRSPNKKVWLPRQDQLQEMVKYFKNLPPAEYSARGLLQAFWEFVDTYWSDYLWTLSNEQTSMEQLWLAFVMKERFEKVWNGNEWIVK